MTEPTTDAQVLLRRYAAGTYEGALDIYEADLPGMSEAGWFPVGQVWGWGAVGSAGWLVSGSSWKPGDGTLAVTYRWEPRTAVSIDQ